ncbi:MAG: tyrosine recombinase XerC [Bacteroidetes bacterium OLB11]|nr:MAG: tyrosine recombinase XerC [Bacteroidetes bacterium OLB11]
MSKLSISDFLNYLLLEKRYSIKTVQSYKNDLEQFSLFAKSQYQLSQLQNANHTQIRSWLASLSNQNHSPKTIVRKISSLKAYYKYLQKNEVISQSPMAKIISPKVPKPLPAFVNEKNMKALMQQHENDEENDFSLFTDKLILEILYQTGMRRAELLNLKLENLDTYAHTLKVLGKGNKERIIPIHPSLTKLIEDYIVKRNQLQQVSHSNILTLPNGKPLYEKYIYLIVKKNLKQVSTLPKNSPHLLRHTFATNMLNRGADLNAVKELLGHSSLASTQVYTHNSIEKLKDIYKKAHPKADE